MGNAVVRPDARRSRHRPRGSPAFRALGQGLHMAASIALMIGATHIGGRQVGATLPDGPSSGHGQHCVAQLGARPPTMRCFTALNAAVAAATDGRVQLLASTTGAALRAIPLNDGAGASDYHVV